MSYKRNADLPEAVKNLPEKAKTIWRHAFNAALEQYGDDETARRVAGKAVEKKYEEKGGRWVLKEGLSLAWLQEAVARRKDVSDADRKRAVEEYGDVPFADETNKKYPIDTEEHIRAAWSYVNQAENAEKYAAEDLKRIKARIVAAWKKVIDEEGPPSEHEEEFAQAAALLEEVSLEQKINALDRALRSQVASGEPNVAQASNVWVVETFDDFVIFTWNDEFYRADYAIDGEGNVAVSNVVKVERQVEYEPVQEQALPRSVLLSHSEPLTVLAEAQNGDGKTFRVRGVALIDDAISANGYYYTRAANDAILEETTRYLRGGGKSTVYSRHEKASYGLPVGKVERLERVDNTVYYEARIANTTEGRDVQVLITEGVLGPTSIRSSDYEMRPVKVNGRQVMAVTRAIIHGVDLVEKASIEGAGIVEILTEGAVIEEVETDMDWKGITFEELKANRPDLLEAYDAAKYDGVNGKVRRLEDELKAEKARAASLAEEQKAAVAALEEGHQAAIATVEGERQAAIATLEEGHKAALAKAMEEAKAPLLEQVKVLTAESEQRKLGEAISGAVKGKAHADLLEAALRQGMVFGEAKVEPCAKAEDVTEARVKAAETLVESMKKALLVEGALQGGSSFRGDVQEGDGPRITEAQATVMHLSA